MSDKIKPQHLSRKSILCASVLALPSDQQPREPETSVCNGIASEIAGLERGGDHR
jgi:hypothetical protein